MTVIKIYDGYDNELAEAENRVSKTHPLMLVHIHDEGFVEDVALCADIDDGLKFMGITGYVEFIDTRSAIR